ncbi:MAG: PAS domain S-box protein [Actinobacteria bacterium]|nr:MAG: PAS domain S-box protein [Actinomycetota bacterium]
MQSSIPSGDVAVGRGMSGTVTGGSEVRLFGLLAIGALSVAVVTAGFPHLPGGQPRSAMAERGLLLATLTTAGILASLSRTKWAWAGTRLAAVGLGLAAVFQAIGWVGRSLGMGPGHQQIFAGTMSLLLLTFLATLSIDFFEHIREGRAELLSDILLISTLCGVAVFLLLHEGSVGNPHVWGFTVTALIAAAAILMVSGWAVLALWCPTPIHLCLMASATVLGSSAFIMVGAQNLGSGPLPVVGPEVMASVALLGLGGILVVEPRLNAGEPVPPRAVHWIRPTLLVVSLVGACGLIVLALISKELRLSVAQSVTVTVVLFGTVGARTLLNQINIVRSARQLEGALTERETAITSLRSAAEVVTTSEARLRLLLDAAVDGIVELDPSGAIVRANGAFCSMVHLPMEEILGRRWDDMVKRSGRASESLATLPETGEAMITTESGAAYLEARSSTLPAIPPGRLLMIRDVTASKTAEQTIRTLFQFLQDRDEDRTRLLQRTNSAIEAERNRIARDLHDGPIQGISATTLSLEAVKMMMETGDTERALDVLRKVCEELIEEAMNLRRIMSDLRPPVLEQRGLIPAVRELCDRWHRELGVQVTVVADAQSEMPSDVETLAYRVVQEALSNVKKHASATSVTVRVEASAGTLQVEVKDDGVGFDPEESREFLRSGRVGLASMRERAELAGGTLTIKSEPGSGTTIMAALPFDVLATLAPTD